MIYMIDVDGTIFTTVENSEYAKSEPILERIAHFNQLYDEGHTINYWTARGGNSGIDWYYFTLAQLVAAGVKFHSFKTGKPVYDYWIDDKAINVNAYFSNRT